MGRPSRMSPVPPPSDLSVERYNRLGRVPGDTKPDEKTPGLHLTAFDKLAGILGVVGFVLVFLSLWEMLQ